MNWQDHLTPSEADDLRTLERAREACKHELRYLSAGVSRLRNTCVNRARRSKD